MSNDETRSTSVAVRDAWDALRERTAARVALGRAGSALPTSALLAFELDHAKARDAVHRALDIEGLEAALVARGAEVLRVHSAALDRAAYLLRPDLGRKLDDASRDAFERGQQAACDVVFVVADGLSALGIERHAIAVIEAATMQLSGLTIGPIVIAEQARVALGDEIGAALNARLVIVVIGERPGLTSPDSVGLYVTFAPKVGRRDAERNCISNVRPQGLAPDKAAVKLAWIVRTALQRSLSGVALKDDSALIDVDPALPAVESPTD